MDSQSQHAESKASKWVWLAFLLGLSVYFLFEWRRDHSFAYIFVALGFFQLAMYAFKYPIIFSKPLLPQLKTLHRDSRGVEVAGFVGVLLVVVGVIWRWYAP